MTNRLKPFTLYILILGCLAFLLQACKSDPKIEADSSETNDSLSIDSLEPVLKFGIPEADYNIVEGVVRSGEVFSDLMLAYNLSWEQILAIVDSAKTDFDLTRIKSGSSYTLYTYDKDSIETAAYFLYQIDPVSFLRLSFKDSTTSALVKLPVSTKLTAGNVEIKSSLYEAFQEKDLPVAIALKLSDIYAWTLDFYRLDKGDRFSFLYETQYAEGKVIGIGKVYASIYRGRQDSLDAYRFYHSDLEMDQFFNAKGENLQKSMLKTPVKFGRISSRYSLKRFHPVQKRYKAHLGTDYAAPYGTPIFAVGNGTVTAAKYSRYNGNYVKIEHNRTYTSQYLHMSKFAKGIRPGTKVSQGQVIGYVGATGLATGPHVCFRLWKYGRQVDHLREKFSPADPLPEQDFPVFNDSVKVYRERLYWLSKQDLIEAVADSIEVVSTR